MIWSFKSSNLFHNEDIFQRLNLLAFSNVIFKTLLQHFNKQFHTFHTVLHTLYTFLVFSIFIHTCSTQFHTHNAIFISLTLCWNNLHTALHNSHYIVLHNISKHFTLSLHTRMYTVVEFHIVANEILQKFLIWWTYSENFCWL